MLTTKQQKHLEMFVNFGDPKWPQKCIAKDLHDSIMEDVCWEKWAVEQLL